MLDNSSTTSGWQSRPIAGPLRLFIYYLLLFMLTLFCLTSYSVYLFYLIFAVPMRKCWGQHSWMNFTFSVAMLNGACCMREAKWSLLWPKLRLSKTKLYQ